VTILVRNKKVNPFDHGFTLIEVLIAIAIFSIGILAVASLQTHALNVTRSSRITTECLTLATQHAERLMALPFYTFEFTTHPDDLEVGVHVVDDVDNDDSVPRYQIQWTVQDNVPIGTQQPPVSPNPITVSKTIAIQVSPLNNPNDVRATLEFIKVWSVN
jgi:prepilin-type N-terminal cleavage/methylation domain-containing protein